MIDPSAASLDLAARFVATIERRRLPLAALLAATGASILGRQLATVSVPCAVYASTGCPALTGLAATMLLLPWLLTDPDRNVVTRRLGPRHASIVAGILGATIVAAIPVLDLTDRLPAAPLVMVVLHSTLVTDLNVVARRDLMRPAAERAGTSEERAERAMQTVIRSTIAAGPLVAWLGIVQFGASATQAAAAVCVAFATVADLLPHGDS